MSETEYSYQHTNGEVVTVGSFEEALGRCAVLGAEDTTPEEARMLFELYAQGQEKMAEENNEETEEKIDEIDKAEKVEVEEAGKSSGSALQNKQVTPKQETAKIEPLQSSDTPKQEIAAEEDVIAEGDVITNKTVQSGNKPDTATGTPSPIANHTPSTEKASAESTSEVQTPTVSAPVEASSISGDSGYSVELKTPEPVRAAATESHAVNAVPAEADTRSIVAEEVPESDKAAIPAIETEEVQIELDEEPGENSRIDEQYMDLDPEAEAGLDYVQTDIETETIQDDLELDPFLPADEQPLYLEESVEYEIPRMPDNQEFIIPAEAQSFDMTEFVPQTPELTAELSLPIEEVEESITLVMDAIAELESEESEAVHEILDDIVQIIAEAQTPVEDGIQNLEAVVETIDTEEELKELFIELFDYLEIEYSLELVESFVKLALQGDMSEIIEALKQDEENSASHDTGTHEIIRQLLAGVQKMKDAIKQAYMLGKSALRLFLSSQNLEFACQLG